MNGKKKEAKTQKKKRGKTGNCQERVKNVYFSGHTGLTKALLLQIGLER